MNTADLKLDDDTLIQAVKGTLEIETRGLNALRETIDSRTAEILRVIASLKGRLICAGVGKSGHVARKIAATLASTGTPAQYVHPSEASHGDLGMISRDDAVLALSKSGETKELGDLIAYCRRFEVPLIAMTCGAESTLAKGADHVFLIPNAQEACGETRAPTTSTTMMMAAGDGLAVALIEARGFTAEDFKQFHPGGALGAALSRVDDLMHDKSAMPLVEQTILMSEVLIEMSRKSFGCVGVLGSDGRLAGMVTDGDLRRNMDSDLLQLSAGEVMTRDPRTVLSGSLAADALRMMTAGERKITQVFVVDTSNRPVGLLHIHDLLRAGLS